MDNGYLGNAYNLESTTYLLIYQKNKIQKKTFGMNNINHLIAYVDVT